MNAAVLFALAVAAVAAVILTVAAGARRWLEVGISATALGLLLFLAVAAGQPAIPVWLLLLAVWVAVVLAGLAAWSVIRHAEKSRTGEETR